MLRIALPNKGRLSEQALDVFEKAGLEAQFPADRALVASLGDEFQAIFVRAQDIPEFVADGAADLGVTGVDLVQESGRDVEEVLDLRFGRCRLVLAVRDESPVQEGAQVEPGTRVATSFPHLTQRYFDELGIPVEVTPVSGAAEMTPHLGVADAVVDLVSTGSTLKVNRLREVGTVLRSSARLVAGPGARSDSERSQAVDDLVAALESVLEAQRRRYLMANVPRDRLDEVRQVLPGISGPTIIDIMDEGRWVAAHAVVHEREVYRTISGLKALGAQGILVTRIERLLP